jgi:hypothetical protein
MTKTNKKQNAPKLCQCSASEALRQLVNFLEQDPDLYEGDDDGTLGRIMYRAKNALNFKPSPPSCPFCGNTHILKVIASGKRYCDSCGRHI